MTLLDWEVSLGLGADISADPSTWTWTDITSYALHRDSITITRGRADEQSLVVPSTCALTLRNNDGLGPTGVKGIFSPRNPSGPYFGLLSRNTPLRVRLRRARDTFNRTVSNDWGTSDSGHVWTSFSGANTNFSVDGTVGKQVLSAGTALRGQQLAGVSTSDAEFHVLASVSAVATGGAIRVLVYLRYNGTGDTHTLNYFFDTSGVFKISSTTSVGGVSTNRIATATIAGTYTANQQWHLKGHVLNGKVRMKAWPVGGTEPGWQGEADTPDLPVGTFNIGTFLQSGNTNSLPVTVSFDDLQLHVQRFVGFVPSWPPRWDLSGRDQWVSIEASGVLRRLGQGETPLRSPLYRAITGVSGLIAYWPMEDARDATQVASAIGGAALDFAFGVMATVDGPAGSASALDLTNEPELSAGIAASAATSWRVEWSAKAPPLDLDEWSPLLRWTTADGSTWQVQITHSSWDVFFTPVSGFPTQISTGEDVDDSEWHSYAVTGTASGGNISVSLTSDSNSAFTTTITSQAFQPITSMYVFPPLAQGGALFRPDAICHVAVWAPNPGATAVHLAANGYTGETAAVRFARLCTEESVQYSVAAGDSEPVGPQTIAAFTDLLAACEAADEGLIVERITSELGFDPHGRRENIAPTLTLDYGQLSDPLEPVDDDQLTRNDVTVTRQNGSSSRVEDLTGPMGTDPITGVGRYDEAVTLNLATDSQTIDHAGIRVRRGTVDELRYPRMVLDLVANADMIDAWLATDVSDRLTVANPPADIPPGTIDQVLEGYTETLTQVDYTVQMNVAPYQPYRATTLGNDIPANDDEFAGHLDWDSCVLAGSPNSTATSTTITTTPLMSTDSNDYPFDVLIGGEQIRFTACTGSSNPQTVTMTRSINGVVKAHTVNDVVTLHPDYACYLAL